MTMTAQDSPVVLNAGLYAECGFSVFPLVPGSKRPAVPAWQHTEYRFSDEVQADFVGVKGFGVVLTPRDLVIDVDPRNFKPGDKPHVRLFEDAGIDPKGLGVLARTGSGGLHIYFKLPAGVSIKKKSSNYPGIDFLSSGCYVVGVGSIHPDTGKPYAWAGERTLPDRIDAPECLIRLCQKLGNVSGVREVAVDRFSNDPDTVERFVEYLKTAPPAIQGQNGDAQTYKVCCKGKDFGLSAEKTLELVLEHYNPRCMPEWMPEDLAFKVRNAFSYGNLPAGTALPTADFKPIGTVTNPNYRGFDFDSRGKMTKTLNNAFNYFVMDDSPIRHIIAWDEFNGMVKLMRPAPWTMTPVPSEGVEWSDTDSIQLRLWLGREKRFDVPIQVVDQAVVAASQLHKIHPVRDYLDGLKWDGVSRLKTWLTQYAKAKDDKYVQEVAEKTILQAVKRVYEPGCKADYVLILEGIQGVGKSTLIEILGGKWYADIVIDPHARDTADAMRGKWFVEFSEMEVTRRADANALKAFITRKTDRFRLAYARRAQDLPRQCVFIGTINPDATNEYLSDSTGNRRFWPVWIHQVDFRGLSQVRDQLFAEAVVLVRSGQATHIIDQEVAEIARSEQKSRQTSDPWLEVIKEWIDSSSVHFVSTKDVWMHALRGREVELSLAYQKRIASCLRELGWEQHVKWKDGKSQRGYLLPGGDLLS